jgi:hypothetical protein
MNERLKHLSASCFPVDTDGNMYATPEIIIEFAELIVRECAEKFAAEPDRPFYGRHVSYHIKKHFGVEQ